jgi:hypothetical protein
MYGFPHPPPDATPTANGARTWHLYDVQVIVKIDNLSTLAATAPPPPAPSRAASGAAASILPPSMVGGLSRIEIYAPRHGHVGVRALTPAERERQRIVAQLMVNICSVCVCVRLFFCLYMMYVCAFMFANHMRLFFVEWRHVCSLFRSHPLSVTDCMFIHVYILRRSDRRIHVVI